MTIKFSKIFVCILIISSLASFYIKCITSKDDQAQTEMMASLFQELGLDKSENMTRDNLRTILDRLLSKMYNADFAQHANFFMRIIEKYTSEVPDLFPRLDIGKYLNQERVMQILQEVVKDHFGDKYADDLKPAFEEMENAYKDLDVGNLSGKADEGQSPNLSGEGAIDQTPNEDVSLGDNHSRHNPDEGHSPNLSGDGAVDQTPNQDVSGKEYQSTQKADDKQSPNLSGEGAVDQTPNQDKDIDL